MSKSKNNPTAREGVKEKFYNGKAVIPVLYIGRERRYMAVQDKAAGKLILGSDKKPLSWSTI